MLPRTKVEQVIGKTFADGLDVPLFYVTDKWNYSRREMVEHVGCANFIAAARLAKVLKRLGITTPNQLFRLDPASLARTRGIGESSLFVAMCILDLNSFDVLKWWSFNDNGVRFSTFKRNVVRKASKRKQEVA